MIGPARFRLAWFERRLQQGPLNTGEYLFVWGLTAQQAVRDRNDYEIVNPGAVAWKRGRTDTPHLYVWQEGYPLVINDDFAPVLAQFTSAAPVAPSIPSTSTIDYSALLKQILADVEKSDVSYWAGTIRAAIGG